MVVAFLGHTNMGQVINPLQPARAPVTQPGAGSPYAKPKLPPAPGASPQGGTTSLPQHLATSPSNNIPLAGGNPYSVGGKTLTPTPGGGAPMGGGGSPYVPPAPPAAPVPASQPPATVPPAPPATPQVSMDPGAVPGPLGATPGNNQKMGDELFKQLMEMLKNPSRNSAAEVDLARSQGRDALRQELTQQEDRARADAGNRGVYYGTPLTNTLGDIGQQYARKLTDLESNLELDQARNYQQDRLAALNAIFQYGQGQQNAQNSQNDLWIRLMQLGLLDGPQYPGVSNTIPMPQGA